LEVDRFLTEIIAAPGLSGYEQPVARMISATLGRFADEVRQDQLGNVVVLKKGKGEKRPKVLLAAHMDEIGLMVTKIEEGGFLRFTSVGGIDPRTIVSQEVILFGKKELHGVIGAKPPHLTDEEERSRAYTMDEMYIDLALPEAKVRELVSVGDVAMIKREAIKLNGTSMAGKAMDDRAGVAVMLACLRSRDACLLTGITEVTSPGRCLCSSNSAGRSGCTRGYHNFLRHSAGSGHCH